MAAGKAHLLADIIGEALDSPNKRLDFQLLQIPVGSSLQLSSRISQILLPVDHKLL